MMIIASLFEWCKHDVVNSAALRRAVCSLTELWYLDLKCRLTFFISLSQSHHLSLMGRLLITSWSSAAYLRASSADTSDLDCHILQRRTVCTSREGQDPAWTDQSSLCTDPKLWLVCISASRTPFFAATEDCRTPLTETLSSFWSTQWRDEFPSLTQYRFCVGNKMLKVCCNSSGFDEFYQEEWWLMWSTSWSIWLPVVWQFACSGPSKEPFRNYLYDMQRPRSWRPLHLVT